MIIINKVKTFLSLVFFLGLAVVLPTTVNAEEISSGPVGRYFFRALPGPSNTEINLAWKDDEITNNYDIVYGFTPNQYLFGLKDTGDTDNVTIGSLAPNATYYFSLVGRSHNESTDEVTQESIISDEVIETSAPIKYTAGSKNPVPVTPTGTSGPKGSLGLTAQPGDNPGEIKLSWNTSSDVEGYDIVYSVAPGPSYLFGVQDIGNINSYVIKSLESGKTYYFALLPEKSGEGGIQFTEEVMVKAK